MTKPGVVSPSHTTKDKASITAAEDFHMAAVTVSCLPGLGRHLLPLPVLRKKWVEEGGP